MTTAERIEAIADNRFMTGLSRLSMAVTPVLFLAVLTVGGWWLTDRLADQADATAEVKSEVVDLNRALSDLANASGSIYTRVAVLEAGTARGRADREKFQEDMAARMLAVEVQMRDVAVSLAAVNATLQAMRDRQAASLTPSR